MVHFCTGIHSLTLHVLPAVPLLTLGMLLYLSMKSTQSDTNRTSLNVGTKILLYVSKRPYTYTSYLLCDRFLWRRTGYDMPTCTQTYCVKVGSEIL